MGEDSLKFNIQCVAFRSLTVRCIDFTRESKFPSVADGTQTSTLRHNDNHPTARARKQMVSQFFV